MNVSRKHLLIALIWAASTCLAFVIGVKHHTGSQSGSAGLSPEPVGSIVPAQATDPDGEGPVPAAAAANRAASTPDPWDEPQVAPERPANTFPIAQPAPVDTPRSRPFSISRLQAFLDEKDPLRAVEEFSSLVQAVDVNSIEQAVRVFEELPRDRRRDMELGILLYKWGTLDGEAATDYAANMEDGWQRGRALNRTLAGWASADADAALAWAESNYEREDNPYLVGVVQGAAAKDLAWATEVAYRLPVTESRRGRHGSQESNWGRAIGVLADAHFQQGTHSALNWAESVPDAKARESVISQVANRYSREDPRAAADWQLDVYEGADKPGVTKSIAWRWIHDGEGADAAEWTKTLNDSQQQQAAMVALAEHWGHHDAAAAAEWLNDIPSSPQKDVALQSFSKQLLRSDPKVALSWAMTITDLPKRNETLKGIIEEWRRRDPEAANGFLSSDG